MNVGKTPFLGRKRNIWLIIAILLVAAVLVALIPLLFIRADQGDASDVHSAANVEPQSFAVGANALLIMKEQSGNISVYPGHTGTITVTPRVHGTVVAPDAHNVRILYSHTHDARGNDQLTVTTDPWFSNTDFLVTIPSTTSTQITLNAGSIDVHAGAGLAASTGSGGVAFDSLRGTVNVRTESGDVTGNNVVGPVTIMASSGSIRLQNITGQVNAQTWSGDVIANASAFSGQTRLQTQSGSVRYAGSLDPRGSYTMQTTNGDVDLTLPADSAFSLQASTGSGSVQNAFGGDQAGNEPRAQLTLHTQNGSIAVVKAV